MSQPEPLPEPRRRSAPRPADRLRPDPASPAGPPPLPPPPDPGGGGGPPGGLSLSAVMDRVVGSRPGRSLASSGPAAAAFAREVRAVERPEPLLATLFWNAATRTEAFRRALATSGFFAEARHIVVAHAGNTRFDLLVMSPDRRGTALRLPVEIPADEVADAFARTAGFRRLLRRYPDLARGIANDAIVEVAAVRPAVVVAQESDEEPTSVPAVAMPVARTADPARSIATVGLVLHRDAGTCLATTAWHALREGGRFLVRGLPAQVRAYESVTDIGLLEVGGHVCDGQTVGSAGIRDALLPVAPGEAATFRRPCEGSVRTVVTGVDPSIVDAQTALATKIYTQPDTRPGDSGVALIDARDHVVGFAARRTSAQALITYSIWIWARQALDALGEKL